MWIGDLDTEEAARAAAQIDAKSMHLDVTKADSLGTFWAAASADGPIRDARQQCRNHAAGTVRRPEPRRSSPRGGGQPRRRHQRYARLPARHVGPQPRPHRQRRLDGRQGDHARNCGVLRHQVRRRRTVAGGTRRDRPHRRDGDHGHACSGQYRTHLWCFARPATHTATRAGGSCHRRHRPPAGRRGHVPRWLAPIGTLEEAAPERLLQAAKRIVTRTGRPGTTTTLSAAHTSTGFHR